MNICMLLTKTFPFDIRVRKEADALLADGHDVTVLCRQGNGEPRRETINGVYVYRYDPDAGTREWMDKCRYLVTQVHPFWSRALKEVIEREGIEVIHIHDLRFADTGLSVGKQYDLPVIADLHENYPEGVRQWRKMAHWQDLLYNPLKLADRIGFPVMRYKHIERRCVQRANRVITVAEEAKKHYVQDCGADPTNVRVIANRADLGSLDRMELEPIEYEGFLITYIGSFGAHRGLETAIRAMPRIIENVPEAQLLIVGSAGEERYGQDLMALCKEHDVQEHVTFTGWVDFERVPSYIVSSDICFVIHDSTPHTNTTIPHKLFQYMALRRPVIVTDVEPLQRVVKDADAGLVIPAGDHEAMAEAVRKLRQHPRYMDKLGENGRHAVEDTYNWAGEARKLRRLYDDLTSDRYN